MAAGPGRRFGLIALFVLTRAITGENLAYGSGYEVIRWARRCRRGRVGAGGRTRHPVRGHGHHHRRGRGGRHLHPAGRRWRARRRLAGELVPAADPSLFTVLGAAAFLGAGYRVPLAAVMFVAETTGRPGFVVPGLLAGVAADLVMGSRSVTAYQRGRS